MISLGGGMPNPSTFPVSSIDLNLSDGTTLRIDEASTKACMQYTSSNGLPSLSSHLSSLASLVHSSPSSAHIVTNGSQDGLAKAFEMLLSPGDALLVESPTYSGSLSFLEPLGASLEGLVTDGGGLVPEGLRKVLECWEVDNPGRRKVRGIEYVACCTAEWPRED